MTHRGEWSLLAAVAGVAVLAFVGAPMSVDALMWTGVDRPEAVGIQLAVAVSGAAGMALAVAAAAWWRWVIVAGVVGVGLVLAIDPPPDGGLSARVRTATDISTVDFGFSPVWAVVLAASAGALFIGVLGAIRQLTQVRPKAVALAGVAACAAYFAVSLSGALRGTDPAVRLGLVGLAAVAAVAAALRCDTGPVRRTRAADAVVLLTAVPTAAVALLGQPVLGTYHGAAIGLLLVAVAVAAAGRDRLLVGALGLVLAAPFVSLVLLHSVVAGEIWYAWPIAAAGVLAGAATPPRVAPLVVAVAAVPTVLLAAGGADGVIGAVLVWTFLALVMAAVAASATAAATVTADLPLLGALAATAAVGVGHALAVISADGPDITGVFGRGGQVVAALALVAAPVLLHLGSRGKNMTGTDGGM